MKYLSSGHRESYTLVARKRYMKKLLYVHVQCLVCLSSLGCALFALRCLRYATGVLFNVYTTNTHMCSLSLCARVCWFVGREWVLLSLRHILPVIRVRAV